MDDQYKSTARVETVILINGELHDLIGETENTFVPRTKTNHTVQRLRNQETGEITTVELITKHTFNF